MADKVDEHKAVHSVEGGSFGLDYNAAADTRVRRKLDWNMLPLFFVLCEWFVLLFDE